MNNQPFNAIFDFLDQSILCRKILVEKKECFEATIKSSVKTVSELKELEQLKELVINHNNNLKSKQHLPKQLNHG